MEPSEDKTAPEDTRFNFNGDDDVDGLIFHQILEMDEDPDDREFSWSIVDGYFIQAEETFDSMDKALEVKDLEEISQLGHFLKGSSATLGLTKVRDGCENIQRYGKGENPDGSLEPDEDLCLKRIKEALKAVKVDYKNVKKSLRRRYGEKDDDDAQVGVEARG